MMIGAMPAYVAVPPGGGRHPAIILLHEIFGVTAELRHIADLLAAEGYLTVVPALFYRTDPEFLSGYDAEGMQRGLAARAIITHDDSRADLTALIAAIRARPDATGVIATWGFCWGGSLAFLSATVPGIAAAVSFYGAQTAKSAGPDRVPMLDYAPLIQAPLYLVFGAKDKGIPNADIERIRDTLVDQDKGFSLTVYSGEDHAFFRYFGTPRQAEATPDAWRRTLAFLQDTLDRQ